jgi:hypothetical protein
MTKGQIYYIGDLATEVKYVKTLEKTPETATQRIILKAKENVGLGTFKDLAYQELTTNCHHSYDCCGHWYGGPYDIKRIGKNKFRILISYGLNV